MSRLVGFLTLPLVTRYLGPDGYGSFSYLLVIAAYFGFFIDFGYLNYGTNQLCEKVDSTIVIGKIISLQILTAIFSYASLIIVSYFFLDNYKYLRLIILSLIYISQLFSIRYFYLASNRLYFNSLAELCGQIVYASLVFTVFKNYPTVTVLIVLTVIQSYVISAFLFFPYARKNKIRIDLNLRSNFQTLKEAYKLGLSSKAEGITASFTILCIGFFLNEQSVGIYNSSYKIYLIVLTIIQAAGFAVMPVLIRFVKNRNLETAGRISLIFYALIFVGMVLSVVTFVFSGKIILTVFGDKFTGGVQLLKDFAIAILIFPVPMFMGFVILAYNKYNYFLLISIASMIFSILISLILINTSGLEGSGYVLPLVSAVTAMVCIYSLKQIFSGEEIKLANLFSLKGAYRELTGLIKK